ncbi:MAG TPA: ComEC/Rec2 family competence protein [Dongiaceae bacterium]|nr:ComEC/Rec2 family competence protein [Dongiaceae bacterium]
MPQFSVPQQLHVSRLAALLTELAARQRINWPCWLAIGLGTGILFYFAAPTEPSLQFAVGLTAVCGMLVLLALGWQPFRPALWPCLILLVVATGFAAASLRTTSMTPHFLDRTLYAAPLFGRVVQVEPLPAGARLTLAPVWLERRATGETASGLKLQVTVLTGTDELQPGDWVRLRADLHSPSGPAAPGAFDFRRQAFFSGIDGMGFSYTARKTAAPSDMSAVQQTNWISGWADRLRQRIGQRIAQILPDESGALAIALVVGNQTALRKADMSAMRDSGLSHLLSISGLHISLAAGLVFFCSRFLLALIPWLALRIAAKKWAAVFGLLGATFYAVLAGAAEPSLSGSVVPTQRSLFMVLIAFTAIILDRSPISLRLVAWSAVILLLWQPESLIGPSFQMSFAAVFALIACFEALRPSLTALRQYLSAQPVDIAGRFLGYGGYMLFWLFSLMLSSVIASLATAPFGLYHFDRLQIYGIAANMLAVPLTGFWLMPAAVVALLLMPLGLDAPFWQLLGWGCEAVLWIGRGVQHWHHAVIAVPAMPSWGLLAASAGLIWICLGQGWHRAIGLAGVAAMALSIATMITPDVLLSESGRLIALRDPQSQLTVNSNRIEKRVRDTWLRRQAQAKSGTFGQLDGQAAWLSCSYEDDCLVDVNGRKVRFDLGRIPGDIPCQGVDLIIVPQRRIACDQAAGANTPLVIDQRNIAQTGAVALYISGASIRMETAAKAVGQRPWSAFDRNGQGNDND